MKVIIYVLLNLLILGMFYYSKLSPHKDKLQGNYKRLYDFFDRLLTPPLQLLRKFVSPTQVGVGILIDMSQFILLALLLILLKYAL